MSSTGSSRQPLRLRLDSVLCALLLLAAGVLAGCASSNTADHVPTAMGGLPAGAPPRPATNSAYPAVNDVPPPRETTVLTSEEQKKLQDELAAARARAAGAANTSANSSSGTRNP